MSDQSLNCEIFSSKKVIPIKIVEQESEHLEELNDEFIVKESNFIQGFQFIQLKMLIRF